MYQLSNMLKFFRTRGHLSVEQAAEVLGLEVETLQAIEDGGKGFPGFKLDMETLRRLASRMTEHGYPITFEELMVKSGLAVAMALHDAQDGQFGNVAAPLSRPTSGKHPVTDEEWEILQAAETVGLQFQTEVSWEILDHRSEERRVLFLQLQALTATVKLFKRQLARS